jgi:hypothetical protein
MKTNKQIENWIWQKKLEAETPASMDSRILMDSYVSMPPAQERLSLPGYRRIFMKTTVKFATAAIILIAAFLSLTLFKTVTPAYAFEQTVQACHSVRFIHIRKFVPQQEEPIMVWAEFFEDGQPKSIRLNLPDWAAGGDGAKEVVWKDNVAQIWFKKKNGTLLVVRERKLADQTLQIVRENDPKSFVQNLMHKKEAGECELQIEQPSDKAEPILITVVSLPDKNKKLMLYVDQATQLPLKLETYQLKDEQYIIENTGEFYDYNQPIDPKTFTFDNLPANVMRIDQVANAIGLEQGKMTNDEIAIEVVRRFWQALIDGDYNTASQMYEGIPADALKKMFTENFKAKIVKIVSVGPVKPHPNPQTRGVIVLCTLKVEKDGQTEQVPFDHIGVRQVYNQPDRWDIFGGL